MTAASVTLEATGVRELTAEQRAAISARSTDVFTEAGAGTGKTGVLVQRYCDAVTEDDVGPEEILAVTFTERAAGELRERIRRELTARARGSVEAGDHVRAAEIDRAAREGERAWITTIHGFCRRLLAAHPVAARMDPRFRVLDEFEAARLGERAFGAALEELIGGGGDAVTRFAAGFHMPRLGDLVRGVHERLRSQGIDPPRLPVPGAPVRSSKDGEEAGALTLREGTLAVEGFDALGSLLGSYHRHYEELKADRAGADFEDLELRAIALLRAPGIVREAWRERFRHLMVDEFQDTNWLQLALIDALRGPRTLLYAVGDEFQSIYRFRHADLNVFRRRRLEAQDDPATEMKPLRENFRSAPGVLAGVNLVGGAALRDFVPLSAGRAESQPRGDGPALELLLTDASEDKPGQETGWKAPEIELEPPASETGQACVARPASSPSGFGSWQRSRGSRVARWWFCCAPTHMSMRTRRRSTGRPCSLRRRGTRVLVPAAGGGHPAPPRGDREPTRRRAPVRGARLTRLPSEPRRAVAAPSGRAGSRRRLFPRLADDRAAGLAGCHARRRRGAPRAVHLDSGGAPQ